MRMSGRFVVVAVFLVSVAAGLALVPVAAQPGPARTYTVSWTHDPGPAAAEVFQVLVDGAVSVTVPVSACTGTPLLTCTSSLTMTTNVAHVVVVKAVNLFGDASSLPFSAAPPGRPAGVVIR